MSRTATGLRTHRSRPTPISPSPEARSGGELTAFIAREVNQRLAALASNGVVCLRLLGRAPELTDVGGAMAKCLLAHSAQSTSFTDLLCLIGGGIHGKRPLDVKSVLYDDVSLARSVLRNNNALVQLDPLRNRRVIQSSCSE